VGENCMLNQQLCPRRK